MLSEETTNKTVRKACIIAGVSLFIMAVVAIPANFGAIQALLIEGDAAQTASNVLENESTYRLGIAGLVLVVILDIIVAWALYVVFKPVNKSISKLTAWFRVVYAGIFLVAISQLLNVLHILLNKTNDSVFSTAQLQDIALYSFEAFNNIWMISLILFSFHLLLLGWLVYKANYAPRILGVLLIIAGLGYFIDGFGALLPIDYSISLAAFTFIGEIVLIFWLLIRGRKLTVIQQQT